LARDAPFVGHRETIENNTDTKDKSETVTADVEKISYISI
jgi:hypothetical protein